jgi:hypothetical protein
VRYVSPDLEDALASGAVWPAFKILAGDPTVDKISAVVRGVAVGTPLDLTPYATEIQVDQDKLQFNLADPDEEFHPDLGSSRAYLQDGAIVRLIEGDERVDESNWVATFTGQIRGQIGWSLDRSSQKMSGAVTVFNRANTLSFKRRTIVSKSYTVGDELGLMLRDVVTEFMGLQETEIRIPASIGIQFQHNTNQLSEVTPWDGISGILETIGLVPFFDGDGRLACYSKDFRRSPSRIYHDFANVKDYEIPPRDSDVVNVVKVTFIDANLSKVPQVQQILGTASVTAGFFKLVQTLDTYWSDDRRQRAENTKMLVNTSVNSTLARIAWGRDMFTEKYQQKDQYHGRITVTTSIFVPILATVALAEYLILAMVGDYVPPTVVGGFTIPTGRISQAMSLVNLLLIMMSLGTGQYTIVGEPFDYAYLEGYSIAKVDGIYYYEENPKEIRNDFLGSFDRADALAQLELTWEQSSGRPRKIIIPNDVALEIGDIIALADNRKFFVLKWQKKLARGDVPLVEIEGFKILIA